MQHIYDLDSAPSPSASMVTIGVFDGVHRGHQYLLSHLVERAHTTGRRAVVLTLFPHPDVVLRGQGGRYYLTTPEQKAQLFGALGVDLVITHPFDERVRQVRAAEFVDQLIARLHMESLWVTNDFALGYKREGNFAFLQKQGAEKAFEVVSINLLESGGPQNIISSTRVRNALAVGDVREAAYCLGRSYEVGGVVIHGDHRGRTIGFPTANVDVWMEQAVPANGVYACMVTLENEDGQTERFQAVTNIGERPTFNGTGTRVEAHLLDFDRDIYGKRLTVEFIERLRGEQKFSGIDALVTQIRADAEQGRAILSALEQTR